MKTTFLDFICFEYYEHRASTHKIQTFRPYQAPLTNLNSGFFFLQKKIYIYIYIFCTPIRSDAEEKRKMKLQNRTGAFQESDEKLMNIISFG